MSTAALLINLGSPESTSGKDVKKYLGEFLMDDHVIDIPYLTRFLLVKGIILNTRPKKSAAAYRSVWWAEGSPLMVISRRLREKVQQFTEKPVYLAMRYAKPSIKGTLEKMVQDQPELKSVFVVPLYPHFAMSSYETVVDRVKELAREHFPQLEIRFQAPFYRDEEYVEILAKSIKEHLPEGYHLLFSYHGIPVRHLKKSDPTQSHCRQTGNCCNIDSPAHSTCYQHQTEVTTRLVAEKLGLSKDQYSQSYQSRLGRDEWIRPYSDEVFKTYPTQGIKKMAVVCPAFVSDCLETLEEMQVEGKEDFLHAGGEDFVPIPCLNEREDWSRLLAKWINQSLPA